MTGRRKFRPLNVPTSTPTWDQIGRTFERRGFQTIGGSAGEESDAFAKYERQGWVTDYNLVATGNETHDWNYTSGLNGWQLDVTDARVWTAGETALLKGIRWEANVPDADDENFAGAQDNHALYDDDERKPYSGIIQPGLGAAMYPVCVSRHMVEQRITSIQFPIWIYSNLAMSSRLRYYRILHDGVPVTGILDGCDEDDWTNRYTQSAGREPGQIFDGNVWQLPTPSSYRFRRGVRLGIDVWVEVKAPITNYRDFICEAASFYGSFTAPAAKWSHGVFGVSTGVNAGFSPSSQTYSLTFHGGTWRPGQSPSSDEFTWKTADGHTISGSKCRTAAASDYSATTLYDFLELDWAREIPKLTITLGNKDYEPERKADGYSTFYYVPEDNADYVRRWYTTYSGPSTEYFYDQSPGGTWNHKGTTTFVPWFWPTSNGTGSFVDQTVTARPTSITVTRTTQ